MEPAQGLDPGISAGGFCPFSGWLVRACSGVPEQARFRGLGWRRYLPLAGVRAGVVPRGVRWLGPSSVMV